MHPSSARHKPAIYLRFAQPLHPAPIPPSSYSIQTHDLASVGGEVRANHPRPGLAAQLICPSANPLPLFSSHLLPLPFSPAISSHHRPTSSLPPDSLCSSNPPTTGLSPAIHSISVYLLFFHSYSLSPTYFPSSYPLFILESAYFPVGPPHPVSAQLASSASQQLNSRPLCQ